MDEDPWLGERRVDEELERLVEDAPLRTGGRASEVSPEEPLRKQLELRGQPRLVVGRHRVDRDRRLDPDQRGQGIPVQGGRARRVEPIEIQDGPEVLEQQEAPIEVRRVDRRHIHAGRPKQARHVHERPRIFLLGGASITTNESWVRAQPQVATKLASPARAREDPGPRPPRRARREAKRPDRGSSARPAPPRPRPARASRRCAAPVDHFQ